MISAPSAIEVPPTIEAESVAQPPPTRAAAPGDHSRAPDISFIVCTHNRCAMLPDCFESIARSAAEAGAVAELIVVDSASTDSTGAVALEWASTAPLRTTVLTATRPGLARARNVGMFAAAGRVLVFTDDDCRLNLDYVSTVLAYFDADTGAAVRGGRVELGDPRDLPFTIKTSRIPTEFNRYAHPAGFLLGANMAMSASARDVIGAFDDRLGSGTSFPAEDADYVFRAYLAGVRVSYEPDMVVHHFHGRRNPADVHRLFKGYMRGKGALYAKFIFDRPLLAKYLWWDLRFLVAEFMGRQGDPNQIGISHRNAVLQCAIGMLHFIYLAALDRVRAPWRIRGRLGHRPRGR